MKADLYFKDDVSDKEYHVEMVAKDYGFVVNISYGRVGLTLQEGTKTVVPVSEEAARKIFDKLVKAKVAKGYLARGVSHKLKKLGGSKMKPMLCRPMRHKDACELMRMEGHEWLCQEKYDGIRAYMENGKLYNRHGRDISDSFRELVPVKLPFVIDGEIMCSSFSVLQSRVHTKGSFERGLLSKKYPARFMAFDICVGGPLNKRLEMLEQMKLEGKLPSWMVVAPLAESFEEEWKRVLEESGEGLVLKRNDSGYQYGKRSPDWIKVKAFVETTAVFTKLDEHPRGVRLETAEGRSVNVNGAQAVKVKRMFDRDGQVECEVQYLPQQNSEAWRFPSFRGVCDGS